MKNEEGLIERMRDIFVTIDNFQLEMKIVANRITPVEKIVYTVTAALGMAALGVLFSLIFKKT